MNLYLADYAAQYRMDAAHEAADAARLAAQAEETTVRPSRIRRRLTRTAGRLRLVLRGSAA